MTSAKASAMVLATVSAMVSDWGLTFFTRSEERKYKAMYFDVYTCMHIILMNNIIVLLGRGPLRSTDGRGWGLGDGLPMVSRVSLHGFSMKGGK